MPKRVLVLSASVGAGHLRAAQAVELAFRELAPDAHVRNVDVLELTNAAFRRLYGKAYLDLVNRAPHVLGYFYDLLDAPRSPRRKSDAMRLLVEKLNLRRFLDLLKDEPWDVVVNTHFLPAEIIASLKKRERFSAPQLTATTDFETHRLWVNDPCERYFTATSEGAQYLASFGVTPERVEVTGIPIHPVFRQAKARSECLRRAGLRGDRPVVLQLSGGFGVGPIERIYEGILAVEIPLEIVAVSGRNEALRRRLERVGVPPRHRATVLGFTDAIDELMACADLVVSKPGGLTTSECLARGAPLAIVNPIPGQESRNSDFLLENQAGVKLNHIATIPHKLTEVLGDAQRLGALKSNARRLGRPEAAFDVARRALELAGT